MTSRIEKLLDRMKQSKSGWKRVDVDKVYEHYGFINGGGSNHDKFYHPEYPQLVTFVPRHRKMPVYVIAQLIKLIARLEHLKMSEETSETEQKEEKNERDS